MTVGARFMRLFAARFALLVAPVYLPERAFRLCRGFAMSDCPTEQKFRYHVLWRYLSNATHNITTDCLKAFNNVRNSRRLLSRGF